MVGTLPGVNPNAKYNDDWYKPLIDKYQSNPELYERLRNNPFLVANNAEFSPNLWQQIGEAFGDSSARDNYYQSLKSSANQWFSDELARFHQTQYDNPVEQAERLRAAGQNPDLTGGITPGSMAENDEPISPVSMPTESNIEQVGSFAMQALQFGVSMASNIQGLQSGLLDLDAKANGALPSLLKDFIETSSFSPRRDDSGDWHFDQKDFFDRLDSYAYSHFRSRFMRKRFLQAFEGSEGSALYDILSNQTFKTQADARFALSEALARNHAYGDNAEGIHVMVKVSEALADMDKKIREIRQKADYNSEDYRNRETLASNPELAGQARNASNKLSIASSNWESNRLHATDPKLAGQAIDSQNQRVIDANEASKASLEVDKIINETMHSITSALKDTAENGKGIEKALSAGALLFFSAFRSGLIPSLPNISITPTTKNFNSIKL